MTGPEATLERRCIKAARAAGGELIKLLPWALRGLPDRLLLLPGGLVVFIEFKAPEGSLTRLQGYWRARLGQLGCRHAVVKTWEEFEALLPVSKSA